MIHDDLFAEFTDAAKAHGWRLEKRPDRTVRRYRRTEGDSEVIVTVRSDYGGLRVHHVTFERRSVGRPVEVRGYGAKHAGKRLIALSWLRRQP